MIKGEDGNAYEVEVVNGKRGITADTALRLGKYFGVSPETGNERRERRNGVRYFVAS